MSDSDFPRNAALAQLVAQARAVPAPRLGVTAQDIEAAVRDASPWRRWPVAVGLAAAAAVLLAVALRGTGQTDPTKDRAAQPGPVAAAGANAEVPAAPPTVANPVEATPEPAPADAPPPIRLATGVVVQTLEGPEAVVVSQWQIEVAGGVYRIVTAAEVVSTVHVRVDARTLDVAPGTALVLDDGVLTIEEGEAEWQDDVRADAAPQAKALAAQAEQAMARGDKAGAIRLLTALANNHPRAAETRTGLVDLARLRAATGDTDRARCAYQLALRRWPGASIAPDIERALTRLGEGPECRGLLPR